MSWDSLKELLGKSAPLLGTLIGGPAGGAVASMLASTLGTEDDSAQIAAAIKNDPDAALKLRQFEQLHKRELEQMAMQAEGQRLAAETQRIESVNQTMRVEIQSDDKFKSYWRPYFGYILGTSWGAMVFAIVHAIITNPVNAPIIITAFGSMTGIWAIALSVLGVQIDSRSKDKQVAMGQVPTPGIASTLASAVASRIARKN